MGLILRGGLETRMGRAIGVALYPLLLRLDRVFTGALQAERVW